MWFPVMAVCLWLILQRVSSTIAVSTEEWNVRKIHFVIILKHLQSAVPKVYECVLLILEWMFKLHTHLESELNCTGCCTSDDRDLEKHHPVAAPTHAGPADNLCPLHCKCNPLGTILQFWIPFSNSVLHFYTFAPLAFTTALLPTFLLLHDS